MNEPSVTLHQQDGGISVQAFADLHGLLPRQVMYLIKRGQVLGARQNPLSKKWWIYPPAKLLSRPKTYQKRTAEAALPDLLAAVARSGEAGSRSRQSGQHAPSGKGLPPFCKSAALCAPGAVPSLSAPLAGGLSQTPWSCVPAIGAFALPTGGESTARSEARTERNPAQGAASVPRVRATKGKPRRGEAWRKMFGGQL